MKTFFYSIVVLSFLFVSCQQEAKPIVSPTSAKKKKDIAYQNVLALNPDSSVNMIVEISAGTTAKYEMDKNTHQIVMDSINGKPRYINYLGYPGNYGMIPNTILPKSKGGDGDPLDILLLGVTEPRGSIQKVRVIGVMKLLDNGEQDDKILAVPLTKKWAQVKDTDDLDTYFPGARDIVSTFFVNYKTKGEMEFEKWGSKSEAMEVVKIAYEFSKKK